MKNISLSALLLTAQAVRVTDDISGEYRPPRPIVVAPWHNYDPNNTDNEEWEKKHTYNELDYVTGMGSLSRSKSLAQYRPKGPKPKWHNDDHYQSYSLTDPRLNIENFSVNQ